MSCGARGEEAGEAVVGWPPDLFGEEAGMVERVEMLLGDGELLSGPPTCNQTKHSAIYFVHREKSSGDELILSTLSILHELKEVLYRDHVCI